MSAFRTWWAKRWPRTLEALGLTYPDSRIVRGRRLVQDVDDLIVSPGEITAWVDQPRRTYGVTIRVAPLDAPQWTEVAQALAVRPRDLAALLDDRLPEDVDRTLAEAGAAVLFPGDGDLATECPCPDRTGTCAHVIAVHHAFAVRFDDDPFLLPMLRGGGRDELVGGIRAAMADAGPPPAVPEPVGVAAASLDVRAYDLGAREVLAGWGG